jgi:excisionase family DNA binding protein
MMSKKNQNNPIEQQQVYTDREAAKYLRIGQTTLWRLRKTGKISFRRAASKIIYTKSDLENYLDSTKRNAFGVEVSDGK